MRARFALLCLCVPGLTAYANAAVMTGTELYSACTQQGKDTSSPFCNAYIHGFLDGMTMGYAAHGTVAKYCLPADGIELTQGRLIIEKYLRDHPDKLNQNAAVLAGFAMMDAFPCNPLPN
jgi:Rap1a immunity proteins